MTGSTSHAGEYSIPIDMSVVGTGPSCRGTMFGGVRIASRTALRAALGEIRGDLGAGVARADDEHVAARVRRGAPVLRRVDDLAAESLLTRPVRRDGGAAVAGGDDDLARGPLLVVVDAVQPSSPRSMRRTSVPNRGGSRGSRA